MALVLRSKLDKSGAITRFDVVRAENGDVATVLADIAEGRYCVLDNGAVTEHDVSYRTVQDITPVA